MEQLILTGLNKLEQVERQNKLLGIVIGTLIIATTVTVSYFIVKGLLQINFEIINYVCKEYFGFKFY